MKKILFSVLALGLLASTIISCRNNQKETTDTASDSTAVANDTANVMPVSGNNSTTLAAITPETKIEAPKFSSEEVNEGFAKFEGLKQEYKAAISSKDAAKIKAVNEKYIEWIKVASNWKEKLTKEENQIYIDYYTKLAKQWETIGRKK